MKAFILCTLFGVLSVSGFSQSDSTLKKAAADRRSSPDYIDNRKMIANPQQRAATKKHTCIFHKKKRQKPAAKDVLKDRNTKDPKLENKPPKMELQGGN